MIFIRYIAQVMNNYHLDKVLKCNEKGYRLIHIWENEWNKDSEEIKRKLIKKQKKKIIKQILMKVYRAVIMLL